MDYDKKRRKEERGIRGKWTMIRKEGRRKEERKLNKEFQKAEKGSW